MLFWRKNDRLYIAFKGNIPDLLSKRVDLMEKILIIDDSKFSQQMLALYLGKEYEILSASGGMLGVQLAKTHLPELILLDLEMPGMNGFEVLRELKKDVKTRDIPVIMITGANQSDAEEKALFLGAVDFVKKPFSEAVVRARVRTHVDLFSYRQTIESQLLIDLITQVPNRRSANIILCEQWDEAAREGTPLSVGIIDIDRFTDVNFTYGFQEAQHVLKVVSSTAQRLIAQHDGFLARYEGDRFIMTFPNTDAFIAENISNAIRLSIYDSAIPNKNSPIADVVTISIGGFTIVPKSNDELADCINRVETAAASAKKQGRNRVVWEQ